VLRSRKRGSTHCGLLRNKEFYSIEYTGLHNYTGFQTYAKYADDTEKLFVCGMLHVTPGIKGFSNKFHAEEFHGQFLSLR
jgi:hypothetical protein